MAGAETAECFGVRRRRVGRHVRSRSLILPLLCDALGAHYMWMLRVCEQHLQAQRCQVLGCIRVALPSSVSHGAGCGSGVKG